MGYNRSGTRRTARMKRHKQLQQRLAERAAAGTAPQTQGAATEKIKGAGK